MICNLVLFRFAPTDAFFFFFLLRFLQFFTKCSHCVWWLCCFFSRCLLFIFSMSISFWFCMWLFNKTAASWNAPKSKEENTFSISKHTLSISISNACLILNFCIYYPWNTVVVAQNHCTAEQREKKIKLNKLILSFSCVCHSNTTKDKNRKKTN